MRIQRKQQQPSLCRASRALPVAWPQICSASSLNRPPIPFLPALLLPTRSALLGSLVYPSACIPKRLQMRHPRFRQGLKVLQNRHDVVRQPQKQFLLCCYILYSWMPTASPTNPHAPLTDCGLTSSQPWRFHAAFDQAPWDLEKTSAHAGLYEKSCPGCH